MRKRPVSESLKEYARGIAGSFFEAQRLRYEFCGKIRSWCRIGGLLFGAALRKGNSRKRVPDLSANLHVADDNLKGILPAEAL